MADVVKLHVNGITYIHATATTLDDPAVATLTARLRIDQTTNPQPPMPVQVKADAGVATLQVYPQRVWCFGAWVGPAPTTSTGGSSGLGIGVSV